MFHYHWVKFFRVVYVGEFLSIELGPVSENGHGVGGFPLGSIGLERGGCYRDRFNAMVSATPG